MAELKSTEFTGWFSSPREPGDPTVFQRVPFNFTAAAAVADDDTVSLAVVPTGWIVTGGFIQITTSFGTDGTLNVGISDITSAGALSGTPDPNAFIDGAEIDGLRACPFWYELNSDALLVGMAIPTADRAVYGTFSSMTTPAAGTMTGFVELYRPLV